MSDTKIHIALVARVQSLVLSPVVPVAYPGVAFTPPAGEYISVTHMPNEPVRSRLSGADVLDRFGILQLDLFTPITADSYEAQTIARASQIAAHFPHDLTLTYDSASVQIVKSYVGRGRKDSDGVKWMTPVFVEYRD